MHSRSSLFYFLSDLSRWDTRWSVQRNCSSPAIKQLIIFSTAHVSSEFTRTCFLYTHHYKIFYCVHNSDSPYSDSIMEFYLLSSGAAPSCTDTKQLFRPHWLTSVTIFCACSTASTSISFYFVSGMLTAIFRRHWHDRKVPLSWFRK